MAEDIKQEMNSTPGCIPSKWNRNTVADGDWLQKYTLAPLSSRDNFLADKISGTEFNLDEEIRERKAGDAYLSGAITSISSDFYTFSGNVCASAENLSAALKEEIRIRGEQDYNLSQQIIGEKSQREAADNKLQKEIDKLEAATDVIMVYADYNEFTIGSAYLVEEDYLTDADVIKVLQDETSGSKQIYYQWYDPASAHEWSGWSAIGSLEPYYSIADMDRILADTVDNLSATVSSNYLSANGTAIKNGRNINVDFDQTKPYITINTNDNVNFDSVSATTAYGSSAKFTNISSTNLSADTVKFGTATFTDIVADNISATAISSTNLIALTATGNSAKFTNFSGTNINGASKTATIDNLIGSAQNGKDAYDKVSTAYWSAYKDSTHSGTGKLSGSFSISAGENLDMEVSNNIIKLNGKPAGVIHDDNLSGLGVQGDLLGLNSAVSIYVPFIANQNRNSAIVEMGNTPVPYNMGSYNEGFAVYRKHSFEVGEGTKTADLGTTIGFTGMKVTHSADGIGGFNHYSTYGEVFDLNYNCGDAFLKHLWVNEDGLNFQDLGNTSYSANLNFVNLEFYDHQNNKPGTNTKYESQYVNASSIYKWNQTNDIITGQSATLSAGSGINFISAGANTLGIAVKYSTASEDSVTYVTALNNIPLSAGMKYNITGNCIEVDNANKQINLSSTISAITISAVTTAAGMYTSSIYLNGDTFTIKNSSATTYNMIEITETDVSHTSNHGASTVTSATWVDILNHTNANYVSASGSQSITLATAASLPATLEAHVYYII